MHFTPVLNPQGFAQACLICSCWCRFVYWLPSFFFQEDYPLPAIDVEKLEGLKEGILEYIPSEFNSTLDLNISLPDKNSTLAPRLP